jgi:glutathione S-transferase
MELRYGPNSPYARKVRVVAIETGQRDKLKLTRARGSEPGSDLNRFNPLVKVPTLTMDNGRPLYDSPVICEYVDSLHSGTKMIPPSGPDRWEALRREALADGMMDAFISWRGEKRNGSAEGAAKQLGKMMNGFDSLESEVGELKKREVAIDSISVACSIGYMDMNAPELGWRDKHPKLAAWYEAFCKRSSMQETAPVKTPA